MNKQNDTPKPHNSASSSLLISEQPILVIPSLAKLIGLNEAIVVQQLHYWLQNPKNEGFQDGGHKWVYNTYEQWQEDNFPFWSVVTVKRLFLKLEKRGLVISKQFAKARYDRQKYYRIDYEKLESLNVPDSNHRTGQVDPAENEPDTNSSHRTYQIDTIGEAKLIPSLTETTTETTNNGAEAPSEKEEKQRQMQNVAKKIAVKAKDNKAYDLALAFQEERDIVFAHSDVSGQAKAAKSLIEKHINPEHVRLAVKKLMRDGMTVADLFSVPKTAVDLANQPAAVKPKIVRATEEDLKPTPAPDWVKAKAGQRRARLAARVGTE